MGDRPEEAYGRRPEPPTRYARSSAGYVAYQTLGEGPRDLLFVAKWTSNLDAMWEEPSLAHYFHRLGRLGRVICFDKRGSGVTDPVPLASLPTLEEWMDDARIVLDAVGPAQAAVISEARWLELRAAHNDLVRRNLLAFHGREIATTGDGFLATFDGPARAVHCAVRIRDAVRDLGLEIRAGLHTGEIEHRDRDVGGIGMHIAARVMGAAQPGEVPVSGTVADLVIGSGIDFRDRATTELKGVPGRWRLLEVAALP